jgi:hypothetical protein
MNADFLCFNDQIINKRDIIRIYKCSRTNKGVDYGIQLVIRNADETTEWYKDYQSKRDRRFETLIRLLC